jgi:hypothetical protein
MTAFVQRGMRGAFKLAEAGLSVAQDAGNDQNKQRLVDRLFGTANYGTNTPREEIVSILTNLLTFNTEAQNPSGLEDGRGDIVRTPYRHHRV